MGRKIKIPGNEEFINRQIENGGKRSLQSNYDNAITRIRDYV